MGRSQFGWDLPPGVTDRMIDEAYGIEGPCQVCGRHVDECICPECPLCDAYGDPRCYDIHGLVRHEGQIVGANLLNEAVREQTRREEEMYEELFRQEREYEQQQRKHQISRHGDWNE